MTAPAIADVAYLGPPGTFTEAAVLRSGLAGAATPVPMPSVDAALEAVRARSCTAAMVPFENSLEGSVSVTLDTLASGDPLVIVEEVVLPVSFALLARSGTSLEDVDTVTTFPHAEAQVRRWLAVNVPAARFVPAPSTADGARAVAAGEADAAVAAPIAAERYGLEVLADDIHDSEGAMTRFVLCVSPDHALPEPTGADRTTLVAYIADDHPGALLEVLTEFAVRGVNLTRLESRPTGARLGKYCFSIDAEGHLAEARVGEVLSALHRICMDVRFLGSYPRADGESPTLRRGTTDDDFAEASEWLTRLRSRRDA